MDTWSQLADFDDLLIFFVLIEKIYQTLETVFHQLSKHLKFCQKYFAVRRIFNSVLGVWIPPADETRSLVFDIFHGTIQLKANNHLSGQTIL